MKYTSENIIEGIYAKIDSMPNVTDVDKEIFKKTLVGYPIEIERNVLEWINDEPITHIECHGESISQTMLDWELDDSWIPFIIDGFVDFKNNKFSNPSVISQFMEVGGDMV